SGHALLELLAAEECLKHGATLLQSSRGLLLPFGFRDRRCRGGLIQKGAGHPVLHSGTITALSPQIKQRHAKIVGQLLLLLLGRRLPSCLKFLHCRLWQPQRRRESRPAHSTLGSKL